MIEEAPHQNTVHYVMAVHGIGIARRGEQALEVARGLMATHPQAEIDGHQYDELTLGKIVSLGSDHITDALQVPIRIGPKDRGLSWLMAVGLTSRKTSTAPPPR